MSSTKEIYWVCRQPTADVWQKIHLLQKYHISVRILPDFAALLRNYGETRLNTIIIGDEDNDPALESHLLKISNHPEYSGVRFVLSLSKANPSLVKKAVNLGFRDIIPIDIPESQWLRRYAFASSGRPTELTETHPQMSMQSIASVQVPGRIAWITEKELWLETRLLPPVGAELSLAGGLADLLGLKQVRLKVLHRYRSHLHFRYSEALLCRWEVALSHQTRKAAVQDFMREQGSLPHYRFYAIIRNRDIRNALVKRLPPDRFQMIVALNKNNMIQEPRFISPDAIVIEDKMCLGAHQANFDEMLANLDAQIPVFVLGDSSRLVRSTTTHRIVAVASAPIDYAQFFEDELGAPKIVNADATPIPKNHPLSFGQINIPTRILNLHPDAVELACSFPLGRFGLFSLDAPIFQQSVQQKIHGKVLDSWDGEHVAALKDFPYHARAIIIDLPKKERDRLALQLVELYSQQMTPKAFEAAEVPKDVSPIPLIMMPEAIGAGPMKTELAKPIRDMMDSIEPSPSLLALETEIKPLEDQIVIDRSYKESGVANFFESVWEWVWDIPKEWKIFFVSIVFIALSCVMGYYFRSPEEKQGTIFTDALKTFQKDHDGSRRLPKPDPGTVEPPP